MGLTSDESMHQSDVFHVLLLSPSTLYLPHCRCVPSEYFWHRPDMASSGFCLLNTVAVAAVRTHLAVWSFRIFARCTIQVSTTDTHVIGLHA